MSPRSASIAIRSPSTRRKALRPGGARGLPGDSLPRPGVFDGAWCWYNSLGTFEDDQVPLILAGAGPLRRPRGQPRHPGLPPRAAPSPSPRRASTARSPTAATSRRRAVLRPGEAARRDPPPAHASRTGASWRRPFFIRYYDLDEWRGPAVSKLASRCSWSVGGLDGAPLDASSTDVIVGAKRRA